MKPRERTAADWRGGAGSDGREDGGSAWGPLTDKACLIRFSVWLSGRVDFFQFVKASEPGARIKAS